MISFFFRGLNVKRDPSEALAIRKKEKNALLLLSFFFILDKIREQKIRCIKKYTMLFTQ